MSKSHLKQSQNFPLPLQVQLALAGDFTEEKIFRKRTFWLQKLGKSTWVCFLREEVNEMCVICIMHL